MMCGIAGVVLRGQTQEKTISKYLNSLNASQRHRGPDSSGTYVNAEHGVGLAHTRLSIIDLRAIAGQPMSSSCGRYTLVFNGEIYNFKSLRASLEHGGYDFLTESDTEALLACIVKRGMEQTLRELKGMFAFALFDKECETLTLARDKLGEKPLYYCINETGLVFSSELKAIFKSGILKHKEIDLNSLSNYLRYGYISAPGTIIKGCQKLEPGHVIVTHIPSMSTSIENFKVDPEPSNNEIDRYTSPENKANELDEILQAVVDRQSISDVPLGSFLSGGIDSTLVTAVLQKQRNTQIDTFTVAFDDPKYNEAPYAKRISQHLRTAHHEITITDDSLRSAIDHCSEIFDEPFADASAIPCLLVNRFAKNHVKVALSGDGGDELFGGYNRYAHTAPTFEKIQRIPQPIKNALYSTHQRISSSTINSFYFFCKRFLRQPTSSNPALKVEKLIEAINHKSIESYYTYLSSFWIDPSEVIRGGTNNDEISFEVSDKLGFLESAMRWDIKHYLPGDNLVKVDRTSMSCGLEVRTPLLDMDIYEFSQNLSTNYKIRKGIKKRILKDVLDKYVPKTLIDRPKMGFTPPLSSWINNDLKDEIDHYLGEDYIKRQGIFDFPKINQALIEHRAGFRDYGNKLWTIFMFQRWYEIHYKTVVLDLSSAQT